MSDNIDRICKNCQFYRKPKKDRPSCLEHYKYVGKRDRGCYKSFKLREVNG